MTISLCSDLLQTLYETGHLTITIQILFIIINCTISDPKLIIIDSNIPVLLLSHRFSHIQIFAIPNIQIIQYSTILNLTLIIISLCHHLPLQQIVILSVQYLAILNILSIKQHFLNRIYEILHLIYKTVTKLQIPDLLVL